MKITKSQLKRIIKEELENVIQENKLPENAVENPESYCIKPGNSYLVDEGGARSGWANHKITIKTNYSRRVGRGAK